MIGREPELAVLEEFLDGGTPLLALVLAGGPGHRKTALGQASQPHPRGLPPRGCGHHRREQRWAVGEYVIGGNDFSLILHWNGTKWTEVTSPNPSDRDFFLAVAASSATNAWAVGQFSDQDSGLDSAFGAFCCD